MLVFFLALTNFLYLLVKKSTEKNELRSKCASFKLNHYTILNLFETTFIEL